jgi:hypothetical protein
MDLHMNVQTVVTNAPNSSVCKPLPVIKISIEGITIGGLQMMRFAIL